MSYTDNRQVRVYQVNHRYPLERISAGALPPVNNELYEQEVEAFEQAQEAATESYLEQEEKAEQRLGRVFLDVV